MFVCVRVRVCARVPCPVLAMYALHVNQRINSALVCCSYRQAQASVLEALPRLKKLNIFTKRPDDYFAEMAKSDQQMTKVRAGVRGRADCGVFHVFLMLVGGDSRPVPLMSLARDLFLTFYLFMVFLMNVTVR